MARSPSRRVAGLPHAIADALAACWADSLNGSGCGRSALVVAATWLDTYRTSRLDACAVRSSPFDDDVSEAAIKTCLRNGDVIISSRSLAKPAKTFGLLSGWTLISAHATGGGRATTRAGDSSCRQGVEFWGSEADPCRGEIGSMYGGGMDLILASFYSFFNVVSCPPAQRAHAQAGARGGY